MSTSSWKQYQEDAAAFFRSLGLFAETDVVLQGVRTTPNIDVRVVLKHVGFDVTWIVECKNWQERVSKMHVLALREIVTDVGADRGILLSESGFQSGAIEAANLTNVQLTSLATLIPSSENAVYAMRLHDLYNRIESCHERYWEIPKAVRIAHDLRPDTGEFSYSAPNKINLVRDMLSRSLRGIFPFRSECLEALCEPGFQREFLSPQDVFNVIEAIVADLERRLDGTESHEKTGATTSSG